MAAEPLGRFPAARTSDCDEAQAAMAATFLPLRIPEELAARGALSRGP
jgi:hypothetical protein